LSQLQTNIGLEIANKKDLFLLLTFKFADEILTGVTIEMKAIEQYSRVVLLINLCFTSWAAFCAYR